MSFAVFPLMFHVKIFMLDDRGNRNVTLKKKQERPYSGGEEQNVNTGWQFVNAGIGVHSQFAIESLNMAEFIIVKFIIVKFSIVEFRIVKFRIVKFRIVKFRIVEFRIVKIRIVKIRIVIF